MIIEHVVIEKVSNVYVQVTADDGILQEMSDFFTFSSPGHQFSPAFKARHWDGKIRLLNLKTRQIYLGLVPYIKKFCKDTNRTFEYLDEETEVYPVDTKNLASALSLPIEPRDYQYLASSVGLTKKRAVLISPTASGKSLIIYMMIRQLLNCGKTRGLLVVPTINLVTQMHSDFKNYSTNNGWDVDKYCQKIYGGESKIPETNLIISTWQSIYDMPKKYFAQFDFIIGDEAHTFKAKSLTDIMTKLINCDVRIGTTGTLDDSKVNKLVLEGLFGPTFKVISTKELIDRKQLADFKIKCIVLKYPETVCKSMKGKSYQEEMDFLVSYEERNRFIRNLALSLTGNTLILFTYVEKHGRILKAMIDEKVIGRKDGRRVFFVCGETEAEDREAVRHITEKENNAIIVASYGTFSTGVNIRNLHNVVFSSPTKSKIRSLQSIGRVLRLGDNKDAATLYDIADDLRYGPYTNFTLKHYEERVKIYSEEKFVFTSNTVRIN
jgi:superfamily II DNA or RNA helicase